MDESRWSPPSSSNDDDANDDDVENLLDEAIGYGKDAVQQAHNIFGT